MAAECFTYLNAPIALKPDWKRSKTLKMLEFGVRHGSTKHHKYLFQLLKMSLSRPVGGFKKLLHFSPLLVIKQIILELF